MSRRTSEANKAIASVWENEQQLVREGKGTRDWTPKQQQDILERGKAYDDNRKAFEGHHMKSAEKYPEYQGDPKNIQFLSRPEHFDAHNGNYQNPTNGYYDVKTGQTIDFGNNPPEPPKAEKLSSPIMGNNTTNEQAAASNSIPKINSQTVASEGGGSHAPPASNNETETTKRGHKPDPTENDEQHKEPVKRGKKEQEPVQNNGNEAVNTQKCGFTPSNENGDAVKTVTPATEQSSKVAEEASKQAAEQAGRETAKTAALGV